MEKTLRRLLGLLTLSIFAFSTFVGCGEQQEDDELRAQRDAALSALADDLGGVEKTFVPESLEINDALVSQLKAKAASDDVHLCEDDELLECQAKLLRFYIQSARYGFRFSQTAIASLARDFGEVPDGSSIEINLPDNVKVEFQKTSTLVFKLLFTQNDVGVGFIDVNDRDFDIRLNMDILAKDDPNSQGGMFQAKINYEAASKWETTLHVSDVKCNSEDPDDLKGFRIEVNKNQELWSGKAYAYAPLAVVKDSERSCDTPVTDATGMVVYTDFIGNGVATKASIYMLNRSETSTASIQSYGVDDLCTNYPAICDLIADEESTTSGAVDAYLSTFKNTHCLKAGSKDIVWDSDCSDVSGAISTLPLSTNDSWIKPIDFYQMSVEIPASL